MQVQDTLGLQISDMLRTCYACCSSCKRWLYLADSSQSLNAKNILQYHTTETMSCTSTPSFSPQYFRLNKLISMQKHHASAYTCNHTATVSASYSTHAPHNISIHTWTPAHQHGIRLANLSETHVCCTHMNSNSVGHREGLSAVPSSASWHDLELSEDLETWHVISWCCCGRASNPLQNVISRCCCKAGTKVLQSDFSVSCRSNACQAVNLSSTIQASEQQVMDELYACTLHTVHPQNAACL